MNRTVRAAKCLACVACVAMLTVWTGCGDTSGQKLAPVKGKVVFDGQGVSGGTLTFRPLSSTNTGTPGKPASAEVQQDGSFALMTFKPGDGATVGKCEVSFLPALPTPKDYDDKPKLPAWVGTAPKTKQVEVKPGQNDFTIELEKMGASAGSSPEKPNAKN